MILRRFGALEVMEWICAAVSVQQMQKDQSKGSFEMSFQLQSIIHKMVFVSSEWGYQLAHQGVIGLQTN